MTDEERIELTKKVNAMRGEMTEILNKTDIFGQQKKTERSALYEVSICG